MQRSSKKAFTMIELIFVIVIIGILAAVAIPKLAATRDDAKISNIIANTRIALSDMSVYYTAQGATVWVTATNGAVTDVPLQDAGGALQNPLTQTIAGAGAVTSTHYLADASSAAEFCVRIDANSTDVNITLNDAATGAICLGVVADPAMIAIAASIHKLGGVLVKRR